MTWIEQPVEMDDDVPALRRRIHEREWELLPRAVALWSTDRLRREGKRVRILPTPAPASV